MKKTFEDFLMDKHAENYSGTDDNMPDAYEDWLSNLDVNDWIDLGNKFKNS